MNMNSAMNNNAQANQPQNGDEGWWVEVTGKLPTFSQVHRDCDHSMKPLLAGLADSFSF